MSRQREIDIMLEKDRGLEGRADVWLGRGRGQRRSIQCTSDSGNFFDDVPMILEGNILLISHEL